MSKIIFGYKMSPAFIHYGVSEEFSFAVYENGTFNFKKNIIDGEIKESKKITIPQSVVEDVKKCLNKYKNLIDNLPESINNHSLDDAFHYFNFLGKKISCLNISRISEDDYKELELHGGKISPYMNEIIQQENDVLEIFESVYNILEDYGLKVYSWRYFNCDWEM